MIPFQKSLRGTQRCTGDERHILARDKLMPTANDKECPVSEPVAHTRQAGIYELALASVWLYPHPQHLPKGHRPARQRGRDTAHCIGLVSLWEQISLLHPPTPAIHSCWPLVPGDHLWTPGHSSVLCPLRLCSPWAWQGNTGCLGSKLTSDIHPRCEPGRLINLSVPQFS